jgi:hypothetical protein
MWDDEVDRLVYPTHQPTTHSCLPMGVGPTYKAPRGLIMVVVGGAGRGKGSFLGYRYLMEGLSSLIPVYVILYIVNGFFPGDAHFLAVSCCYLGVFPRHNDVGW